MKRLLGFLLLATLLRPATTTAASLVLKLDCESSGKVNGRTLGLSADFGSDGFRAVLRIDAASSTITNEGTSARIVDVTAWSDGVFTWRLESASGFQDVVLYAVPTSVRKDKGRKADRARYSFVAIALTFPDFVSTYHDGGFRDVRMRCAWEKLVG